MKFNVWFKKQFGYLPMPQTELTETQERKNVLEQELRAIALDLSWDRIHRAKYDASLKAWTCTDRYKKKVKP